MSSETIRRLDELFRSMPVLLGGSVPLDEIEAAEKRVGLKFSAAYREFLERYGGAMVGSLPVFGLRKAEVMADDAFSVADMTARFRSDGWQLTSQWVVVSMDLAGNPIGLTEKGEVRISDHDAGAQRLVAGSFEDFIVDLLDASRRG